MGAGVIDRSEAPDWAAPTPVLRVHELHVAFEGGDQRRKVAVDGLSLRIEPGELVALVGRSGAGKSTLALALLGLLPPGASVQGSARLDGHELVGAPEAELRALRGSKAALVPQEAGGGLDPLMRVGTQIVEQIRAHASVPRRAARALASELLARVGFADPAAVARAHPHELSGGMRQRALIAMALSCEPRLLICDEPTSALDRRAEAGILELLHELRSEVGMGILLVTHDLGAVARSADRVAVMRDGRIVEEGPVAAVLSDPRDRHTSDLLDAVPWLGGSRRRRLPGSLGGAEAPRPGEVHTS
jgi:peptide/nickel transport system ATP-binding protein